MTSCRMTHGGAEKCLISNTPLQKHTANFSMCCMKLCKENWNWKLKNKIVRKFIQNKQDMHESSSNHHWFSITEFLSLFKVNLFLPPPGGLLARIFTLVLWFFINETLIFYSRLRDHLKVVLYEGLKDIQPKQ